MSIAAVVGRIDQILGYQQALLDPASVAAQTSPSTSTGAASSGSTFAAQLASAQEAQSAGSTLPGTAQSAGSIFAGTDSASTPAASPLSTSPLSASGLQGSAGLTSVGASNGLSAATRMLAAAQSATGGTYSQANHNAVADTAGQIRQMGTDCSGFVSYLMGPNGLGAWSQSYATPGIPTAPNIQPGKGSYVTIWNNPNPGNAGHVWIEILGQYFESSGSGGVHQMSQGEVNQYLSSGQYQPLHPAGM